MKKSVKKMTAFTLALGLLAAAAAVAPQEAAEAAAKKVPTLSCNEMDVRLESSDKLTIKKNKTTIVKTVWTTSDKDAIALSAKKKTSVKLTAGFVDKVAKVTAKVTYKVGKKKKTKKLVCKVHAEGVHIGTIGYYYQGNTDGDQPLLDVALTRSDTKCETPFDAKQSDVEGVWTTNAAQVVRVTNVDTDKEVKINKVVFMEEIGNIQIYLDEEFDKTTKLSVEIYGFEGCGVNPYMAYELTMEMHPITFTSEGYHRPTVEKDQEPYTVLLLKTDVSLLVGDGVPDFTKYANPVLVVKDETGKEVQVDYLTPVTETKEGDGLIIGLKGGMEAKSFTVEFNSLAFAMFPPDSLYKFTNPVVTVDKEMEGTRMSN